MLKGKGYKGYIMICMADLLKLFELIDAVVDSSDDTGCSHDPDDDFSIATTVVHKDELDELAWKRKELQGM